MAMLVAGLLALQYNLFRYVPELSDPRHEISLAEAVFLTVLLAICIFVFILRRLYEERRDTVLQAAAKTRLREFRGQASSDSLTSLANRRSMLKALTAATASSPPEGRKHAFFLIDLDDFKRVNDLHGHTIGDQVLRLVAQRIRKAVRPGDLLARLGGDEFALLCYDVDREAASAIALRLLQNLESQIRVGGHSYKIGASIGVALIPDNGANPDEIIHHADLAMYRAKAEDRSSVAFF
jgi:diguanylate cyclase (GGDEF)-like protein